MSLYPFRTKNQRQGTSSSGVAVDRGFIAHLVLSAAQAVAAAIAGVLAAVTDTGVQQVITAGLTNPPYPRSITATAGGTAVDIGAIQVIVEGTNIAGETITETLPVFTANTPGTEEGSKAFKTVTKVTIPAHDGLGATTSIGFGDKLGLPDELAHNTVQQAFLNNVLEGTAPTVNVDTANVENNTVDLNSALDGTAVDVYYIA